MIGGLSIAMSTRGYSTPILSLVSFLLRDFGFGLQAAKHVSTHPKIGNPPQFCAFRNHAPTVTMSAGCVLCRWNLCLSRTDCCMKQWDLCLRIISMSDENDGVSMCFVTFSPNKSATNLRALFTLSVTWRCHELQRNGDLPDDKENDDGWS